MLQALVHRLTLQARRFVHESLPAPRLGRAGEAARPVVRGVLFGALAAALVAVSGLATVYAAHLVGGPVGALAAWLAGAALVAASPAVAALATTALLARFG